MTTNTQGITKKYLNNAGTVESFFKNEYEEGYAYGKDNSNVFYIGSTLYSYGYHFVLAMQLDEFYLVNADTYSSSTGKHQSYVHRECPVHLKIEIPFSALDKAGIRYEDINVIDKQDSRYIKVERKVDGETKMVDTHLMGGTLFEAYGKYYLSGIDETAKDLWKGFFLTQLVRKCDSVEDAFVSMQPIAVQAIYENNSIIDGEGGKAEFHIDIKRQGEYFFIPVTNPETLSILKQMEKEKAEGFGKKIHLFHKAKDSNLRGLDLRNSRHVVTNYANTIDGQFAKGTCRHIAGEHRMLKLDGWHLVIENNQVQSWSSDGRID